MNWSKIILSGLLFSVQFIKDYKPLKFTLTSTSNDSLKMENSVS